MCQLGQRFYEKMPVLSALCAYDKITAWELDSLCGKCNTNFTTNWIRVSFICSRNCVANHITLRFPLLLEFSLTRSHRLRSRFYPGSRNVHEHGPKRGAALGKVRPAWGTARSRLGSGKLQPWAPAGAALLLGKCDTCSAESVWKRLKGLLPSAPLLWGEQRV